MKEGRKPVDGADAMKAIRKLAVEKWRYKDDSPAADGGKSHIGPMAQDAQQTLGDTVAPGGRMIDLVSANGITMAAVKDLDRRLEKVETDRSRAVRRERARV